jgi:hypothetical protein
MNLLFINYNGDKMKKFIFNLNGMLFSFIFILSGCSPETNVVDPADGVQNSNGSFSNMAVPSSASINILTALQEDGYFYKISPPDESVQWENMIFSWAPARSSFVSGGKLYSFSQYRLTIDGMDKYITGSIGTTNCSINYPEDGELHSWQLNAYYSYSGGTHIVPYNGGEEWQVRIGLDAPVLYSSWSNNHPYITWNSVPGATGYIVIPSYGGYSLVSSTNFLETNYTGPGSSNTISYYVYAFNGTWPISCIPSPNSNTVYFSVN